MIEWTQQERQFAEHTGDGEITEVIDGFNRCANSEQMLRYLLEMPPGWACERWSALPISKFGDVLHTIRSAENNEVGKLREIVKELADALQGCVKALETIYDEECTDYGTQGSYYKAIEVCTRAREEAKDDIG